MPDGCPAESRRLQGEADSPVYSCRSLPDKCSKSSNRQEIGRGINEPGEDKGLLSPPRQGVLGAPGKPQGLDRMAQERPGEIGGWHFWQFRGAFSSDG